MKDKTVSGKVGEWVSGMAAVTFAWEADTNFTGYRLLSGERPGIYNRTNVVGRTNTFTVANMPTGRTFWVVVGVEADGFESDPSNEITFPQGPRLSIAKNSNDSVTVGGIEIGFRLQQTDGLWGPWRDVPPPVTNGVVTFPAVTNAAAFFTVRMAP